MPPCTSRHLFDYYVFAIHDDDDARAAKEQFLVRQLPSIRFFPLGSAPKKEVSRIFFEHNADFDEVQKDILELIDDKTFALQPYEVQRHLEENLQVGKILMFLLYDTPTVSLTFRVLSQLPEYQHKFAFFTVKDPDDHILQQFQVQKLPEIVGVFRDLQEGENMEDEILMHQVKMSLYGKRIEFQILREYMKIVPYPLSIPSSTRISKPAPRRSRRFSPPASSTSCATAKPKSASSVSSTVKKKQNGQTRSTPWSKSRISSDKTQFPSFIWMQTATMNSY